MSSIIVLDSSDEDESPPKKPNLKSSDTSHSSAIACPKQRIPSGITVTPRTTPVALSSKIPVNAAAQPKISPLPGARVNHANNHLYNDERQTPTPPKAQVNSINQAHRRRKTPTPPQPIPRLAPKSFANMNASNIMSPAVAATTMSPLPPIMPMITGVHSMAAGATPPLQLMATPPHNLGPFAAGLNEQMLLNPHMFHTNLPPNTTITAHSNSNPNQNNLNNNFKIHLPPKTATTPSPAASPASSAAPKTPSPQLGPSQVPRTDKPSRRIKPTTVLKPSDEAWLQQRHKLHSQLDKRGNETVELTMESPKSSARPQRTPITSPSTPKSHKSPSTDILDLTDSPERNKVINLTDTPSRLEDTSLDKQKNGDNTSQKVKIDTNGKGLQSPDVNKESEAKLKPPPKRPLEPEYAELIKVCREADKSDDMEKLIKNKLIKYYYDVHEDFVRSKSFRKSIRKVVEAIRAEPDLVYYNLKTIVEELKVRRKAKIVEVPPTPQIKSEDTTSAITNNDTNSTPEAPSTSANSGDKEATITNISTGSKKLDEQIKKLNKALYVLTKRIEALEETEVEWDDDDSSFLQVERFKKRACQIYEKICDLTGESKSARRLVKKPIKFNETRIPQFNKTLQAFINRTKEFPDYYDVLRMLEHCNRTYSLGLVNFEMKNIAEDAFIKVGKLLQSRRKAELYETVTHYGGNAKDPAQSDPALAAKLSENQKNHKKISDILEKYARKQDMPEEEDDENKSENIETKAGEETSTSKEEETTSEKVTEKGDGIVSDLNLNKPEVSDHSDGISKETVVTGLDDSDDEDEEDEDDYENLEEQVETLANGEVSDNESDNENNGDDKQDVTVTNIVPEQHQTDQGLIPTITDSLHATKENNLEIECPTSNVENNNNIENQATKTSNHAEIKDCMVPPNGKLKESTKLNICNNSPNSPDLILGNTSATTTAIADLKIVPVPSLNTENLTSITNSECNAKISPNPSGNKSLEEIVISDEES